MDSLQVFGVRWPDDLEMYDVVGESFRVKEVREVGSYIRANAQFIPHRACLVPINDNAQDSSAVGVFFVQPRRNLLGVRKEVAAHVGFLASDQAAKFRRDMKALGYDGYCMECAGCVLDNEKTEHPSVRIYVPLKFGTLAKKGFLEDKANSPSWLSDSSPISRRAATNSRGGGFSDDELRRLFCFRAQQKGWNSLPDKAESALVELRQLGAGSLSFALKEWAADDAAK